MNIRKHDASVVFDETSIIIDAVSENLHSWTIVSDVVFTVTCDGVQQQTACYGEQFIYHKSNFNASFGALVRIDVQSQDGSAPLVIELRKGVPA